MKMENPSGVTAHRIEKFLQGPKILVSTSKLKVYYRVFRCQLPKTSAHFPRCLLTLQR
jgi:hypothetical protein